VQTNSVVCYNWGKHLRLLSVKANAFEHYTFLGELPELLRDFLIDADKKVKKNYLRITHEVYNKCGFSAAVEFATKMTEEGMLAFS